MGVSRLASRSRRLLTERRTDVCCLAVLVLVALAFFAPALRDGTVFGGFDLDSGLTSLTAGLYGAPHSLANGDAVSQMVSWNALDWRLVHAGHFPLWNDYSVLGMPEFLNFESSVLSLPDVLSYLAPLRAAFLVVVVSKVLIAGTGTYLAARVLGLRPLAALFGGLSFMLAGAFVNWVTWPLTDVFCWAGYLLALLVLAARSEKWRYVVLLAVVVAFSVYGGFPEANVMLAMAFAALAAGALVAGRLAGRRLSWRRLVRPLCGGVAGAALSAPLWLPGLQVLALSHRANDGNYVGLPTSAMALLFSQGYAGLPTGPSLLSAYKFWPYYESVAYVGVVAAVLALVAVLGAWRRPLVAGLALALLLSFVATYEPRPLQLFFGLVDRIPELRAVRFERMRTMSAFLVALLGAVGLDELRGAERSRVLRRAAWLGALAVSGVVAYLLVDSLGVRLLEISRRQRLDSLVWPVALALGALVVVPFLASGRGGFLLRRGAAALLVAGEGTFLFTAGVGIPTYGHTFYGATAATARLEAIVGDSLVGLDNGNTALQSIAGRRYGVRSFGVPSASGQPEPRAGLYPNVNLGYGIHLFGVHDPLTPAAYYRTWPVAAAAPVQKGVGLFVPAITSAALARRYGIGYVLSPTWLAPPVGTRTVGILAGDERLSAVPGAARFSFPSGGGRVSGVVDGGDGSFSLTTTTRRAASLVMAVTALPGWHLTVDGHPAALAPVRGLAGVEQSARIPAGVHRLVLSYLPRRLVLGLGLALAALLALVAGGGATLGAARRRRARDRAAG